MLISSHLLNAIECAISDVLSVQESVVRYGLCKGSRCLAQEAQH